MSDKIKAFTLNINSEIWILQDDKKSIFETTIDEIYNIYNNPNKIVCKDTISNSIKKVLELEITARQKSSEYQLKLFDNTLLYELEQIIESQIMYFDFYEIIEGIEITNVEKISCGKVELFIFDEKLCNEFSTRLNYQNKNSENFQSSEKYFFENFMRNVCVKSTSYGDEKTARKNSYKQIREVINFFRYIVCLLIHERITENIVKINLHSEAYKESHFSFFIKNKDETPSLVWGSGRKSRQNFCIDQNRLDNIFFLINSFNQILNSDSITEIEESILKAIYWIGEAQNEFDPDIAFIKYWTSIECLFSEKNEITQSLAKGVTINIVFSGYVDIQNENSVENARYIYDEIKKLYKKRSEIIHKGNTYLTKKVIDEYDVSSICKYAAWSIINMFYLRSINYITKEQIKIQTERLSSILKLT